MLGYLRRNADSWFTKGLLAVIAIVFIFFFGSGALTSARSEMVAEVNGEAIRQVERDQLARRMRSRSPGADAAQLRQLALDSIIEERLMLQAAQREGFVVSKKELRRAIIEDRYPWVIPSFQDEQGNFDPEAYGRYLEQSGNPEKTQRRIEQSLRQEILISSLEDAIRAAVLVSDTEVREGWEKQNSKRNVDFVRVSTGLFREDVEPDDDDLSGWVTDNGEAIQERYERDFERKYNKPKKVRARHILLKFGEDDDESLRQQVRDRMAGILTEVNADGAEFAELAAKYSEDTSATRGGDLDFFDAKRMVKPFSDAAFAMDIGEISGIVETRYGLHIIKVEEIAEPEVQALDEVQVEIAGDLYKEEKAPELARAYAERLVGVFDGSLDQEASDALLAEHVLQIQETGDFGGDARTVPKIGRAPEVVTAAFALKEEGAFTATPIEIPTGFVVIRLKSATEPDAVAYEEEKGQVRDRLVLTRQTRAIQAFKAQLKEEAVIRVAPGA
jgi:peptidyl-prolyl cis-trans isomerase D